MTVRIRRDEVSFPVTFTVDTSAYASADLVADVTVIGPVAQGDGGIVTLEAIHLLDKADQKVALHFVFTSASTTFGTLNSAPNISDTNAEAVVGRVGIATTDYTDFGGVAVASKVVGLKMKLPSTTETLYVAVVNDAGTPTYAAADLIATFIFSR